MKYIKYLLIGIVFGIIMTKSEVISWYRIYEMFKFQSCHMYGVIGSAVGVGIILVQIIKRSHMHSMTGQEITFSPKDMSIPRYLFGGIIFGLGWAMTGACPGPMFVLLGNGFLVIIVAVIAAILGTYTYGVLRPRLPH